MGRPRGHALCSQSGTGCLPRLRMRDWGVDVFLGSRLSLFLPWELGGLPEACRKRPNS